MTLDLDAVAAEWLKVCGACDAGIGMCVCTNADPRPTIQRLVDTVLLLRIELAEIETRRDTTWTIPPEPHRDVRVIRDSTGRLWERIPWPFAENGSKAEAMSMWTNANSTRTRWKGLIHAFGPLTDATPDPT